MQINTRVLFPSRQDFFASFRELLGRDLRQIALRLAGALFLTGALFMVGVFLGALPAEAFSSGAFLSLGYALHIFQYPITVVSSFFVVVFNGRNDLPWPFIDFLLSIWTPVSVVALFLYNYVVVSFCVVIFQRKKSAIFQGVLLILSLWCLSFGANVVVARLEAYSNQIAKDKYFAPQRKMEAEAAAKKTQVLEELESIKTLTDYRTYTSETGNFQISIPSFWSVDEQGKYPRGSSYSYRFYGEKVDKEDAWLVDYYIDVVECDKAYPECDAWPLNMMQKRNNVRDFSPDLNVHTHPKPLEIGGRKYVRYDMEGYESMYLYLPEESGRPHDYYFQIRGYPEQIPMLEEIIKTFKLL